MNPLLHGHNPTSHIVAVQQKDDQTMRLYRRVEGTVTTEEADFFPFFFLSHPSLLSRFEKKHWLKELTGENFFKYLAVFTRWNDLWDGVRVVLDQFNQDAPRKIDNYSEAEFLHLRPDPVAQYLMQSGITLFKAMVFEDLHRLQLSFVSAGKAGRSVAQRTEDRILAIALRDSRGWETTLDGRKLGEKELLQTLVETIRARDPDCLEGHFLFERDLPYLLRRFELHGLECELGRDGSPPRGFSPPTRWPEPDGEGELYELAGRHLIDTSFQADSYDFSRRALESPDLATVARHFLSPVQDRIHLTAFQASMVWDEQPDRVVAWLKQNTIDIDHLSNNLSPSSFYLTQMVPLSFSAVVRTGSAMKIESLLLREYLRQKHSVPRPSVGTQTTGGYADLFRTGVFERVLHADVESLYPSIILSRSIRPASDHLGIYDALLRDLVTLRLETKRAMNEASDRQSKARLDAMQSAFKVLINSFYGYLGYSRGLFNDYAKADEITKTGQELLKKIVRQIELHNGLVLEVDTDGVFFLPPDNVTTREQEDALIGRISDSLPEGIRLVPAGRYKKMLSYKKKNYALLEDDGSLIIKGSSLVSRSMERFLRRFLRLAISNVLDGNIEGLHQLYITMRGNIINHEWEVADFCRTEMIHDPFPVYERQIGEGKRNPGAVYEVARRAGIPIRPGDRISYYVTGTTAGVKVSENCRLAEEWDPNFADENTAYYLGRLEEAASKFEALFTPEDFRKVFASEDLFGFNPASVKLISRAVAEERGPETERPQDRKEFKIWLGDASE